MTLTEPKFTVAIVGGGIAGLTTAAAISHFTKERHDIHIDIYESARQFTEIGAGVGMYLRPWKAMKTLGFGESLSKLLAHVPKEDEILDAFKMRKADQPNGVSFYEVKGPIGTLGFHRAAFLETLQDALKPDICSFHFSKRLASYSSPSSATDPVVLNFQDGTSAKADVLLACDGIHSVVRHQMLGDLAKMYKEIGEEKLAKDLEEMKEPVWSGSYAYRGIFPKEKLAAVNPNHRTLEHPINYVGKNRHIIVFPVPGKGLINVVAFVSYPDQVGIIYKGKTVEDRSLDELLAEYEGWEEEVIQLLKCIDKPSRWAICCLRGIPTSVSTSHRVALLGDAAHATTPHQGSGAGQAIEDAYVLGSLLAHPACTLHSSPTPTLGLALKVYETVRLPHGNEVQRRSALNGRLFDFEDARFAALAGVTGESESERKNLREIGIAIRENWRWAWETDVEDDRKRAVELFEEMLRE